MGHWLRGGILSKRLLSGGNRSPGGTSRSLRRGVSTLMNRTSSPSISSSSSSSSSSLTNSSTLTFSNPSCIKSKLSSSSSCFFPPTSVRGFSSSCSSSSSSVIPDMPPKATFGSIRTLMVVIPGISLGMYVSASVSEFLEETELFIYEDDDDDD